MAYVFANNVSSTLAAALTNSATTITLASAANLPSVPGGDVFAMTLNDAATQSFFEIVYVTAISGSNLTVTRGQEGTTARSWLVGDFIFAAVTAGELSDFSGSVTATAPIVVTGENISLEVPLAEAYGGTGTTTPGEVAGTGIAFTGTWPNQTINNTGVVSLNGENGVVALTGSGGAVVTEPSAGVINVNVDTTGFVEDITSTGGTISVTKTGQTYDLELGEGIPLAYTVAGALVNGLKFVYGTCDVTISSGAGSGSQSFSGAAIFSSASSFSTVGSVLVNGLGSGISVTRIDQASNSITIHAVQITGTPVSGTITCAFQCIGY